jgi:tetratricopeptide (TPR) repeat protein
MCSIQRNGLIAEQRGLIRTRWPRRIALFLALWASAGAGLRSQTAATQQQEIHAHFQKAQQAIQSKDIGAAEREFRAVIALDPGNLDARGNLGVMQFFQTDWAGAAEQFRKVLEKQPNQWKVQAYLGICEGRLGHPAEARRLLKVALPHLTAGPFATQAGLELAEILYQSGDLDGAVDVIRILLPSNPTNVDVLYTTARVYADLASRSRDVLLLTAPESARTHQLMAEMLINRGEARAAAAQYRQALDINRNLPGVHFELGEAILQDSRQAPALEAAEKEFRAALAENPADANAEYRLGTIYALRRDYQTAIEHFSRALQIQPDNAYAEQGLGAAWMKMGNPEKAREHLLAATHLNPLYPTAHYQLSTVYRQLGRETESRQETAAFQKLEDSRKRIDQVYMLTRGEFPESNPTGPDTSGN